MRVFIAIVTIAVCAAFVAAMTEICLILDKVCI